MATVAKLIVILEEFAKIDGTYAFQDGTKGEGLLAENPNQYVVPVSDPCEVRVQRDADLPGSTVYGNQSIDVYGWLIRNPNTAKNLAITTLIESGTDPTYAAMTTRASGSLSTILLDERPFALYSDSTFTLDKFWKFTLSGIDIPSVRLSMLVLGRTYSLTTRWNWNGEDTYEALGAQESVGYGRTLSRLGSSRRRRVLQRDFEFLDTTNMNVLRSAFAAANGAHGTLIYVDQDMDPALDPNSGILCRFRDNRLDERQVVYDLWNVSVRFVELAQLSYSRPY